MAKMKRPIGDLVSGKIGNVVFVTMRDKSYVRSAPNRQKGNWTVLQNMYRQRLSNIARLWRSIPTGLLQQSWNQVSNERNGYASFVKANMPALEIDGSLIDPTLLTVTEGKLPSLQHLKAERPAPSSNLIHVSWQNDPHLKKERATDALMALTFVQDHFSPLTDTGLQRADQSGTFPLPPMPPATEGPVTLFLFMSSNDSKQVSKSVSLGIE